MKKEMNCLSLNGGGVKGLIALHQCEEFHKLSGGKFHEHFDIIGGTSTGALCGALFSVGYSPTEVIDIYKKELPKIFKKGFLRFGIFQPKYKNDYFIGLSKELLGDKQLKDCLVKLMVPAFNADTDKTIIFKSYDKRYENHLLREVVLASSAAPTFFDMIVIDGDHYKDGGLGYNNPSDLLLQEGIANKVKTINILSITTGKLIGQTTRAEIKGGIMGGASVAFNDVLREQDIKTHQNVEHAYKYYQKGLYVRCESILKNASEKMDDASKKNIEAMILDGKFSAELNRDLLVKFNEKIVK